MNRFSKFYLLILLPVPSNSHWCHWHLVSVFRKFCLFIKNFVTMRVGRLTSDVVLFSVVAFKTLDIPHFTFHLRCGEIFRNSSLLLQIFSWFRQCKNFENRLILGKVKAYKTCASFWATLYIVVCCTQHGAAGTVELRRCCDQEIRLSRHGVRSQVSWHLIPVAGSALCTDMDSECSASYILTDDHADHLSQHFKFKN